MVGILRKVEREEKAKRSKVDLGCMVGFGRSGESAQWTLVFDSPPQVRWSWTCRFKGLKNEVSMMV